MISCVLFLCLIITSYASQYELVCTNNNLITCCASHNLLKRRSVTALQHARRRHSADVSEEVGRTKATATATSRSTSTSAGRNRSQSADSGMPPAKFLCTSQLSVRHRKGFLFEVLHRVDIHH